MEVLAQEAPKVRESKIVFPKGHISKCRAIFNNLGMIRRRKLRTGQVDQGLSYQILGTSSKK